MSGLNNELGRFEGGFDPIRIYPAFCGFITRASARITALKANCA